MKKIHVPMILTLSVFIISHAHASESKAPMEGFYLGANIGYSKYKIEGFAETFPPDYLSRKRTNLNIEDSNPLVRFNVGYGHYGDNRLFAGIELGYQKMVGAEDYKITNTTTGHEVDVKYSGRIDVGLLIGYRILDNGLLYGRLGYGITDVNISPHDIGSDGGAYHNLYGPIWGIGYSYMLNRHLGVRAEGNYLSIHHSYNNDKNDSEIYDIKIKDAQLQFGLFYSF